MKKSMIISLFSLAILSCNESREPDSDLDKRDTVERMDTIVQRDLPERDKDRNDFTESSKRKIDELDRKIDSLDARWESSKGENRKKYEARRDELKKRSRDLKAKLDSSKNRSSENWDEFKKEFRHDMDKLGESFEDLFEDNKK